VEIGGGSGNFRSFAPQAVSLDIVASPWLDLVADAQALPFADRSVQNLVMLDVLHHIEFPLRFLREASRVLVPGGRVIAVEPGITALSGPFYRLMHEEPVDMAVDPLRDGSPTADKDPYSGNQAIPTLLARRDRQRMARLLPELPLFRTDWLSIAAYPMSGGFQEWSMLTPGLARKLLWLEDRVAPAIGPLCGFRVLLAWQLNGGGISHE
jgi:SAM-dependent methyltransferase